MLESGLKRIITHGRAFSGMMTGVIELDLSPTAKGSDQIIIQRNDQSQRVYTLGDRADEARVRRVKSRLI